jgi:hypothetical protein
MRIDQIQVGYRYRKDLGDVKSLAASIAEVGLLRHASRSADRQAETAVACLGQIPVPGNRSLLLADTVQVYELRAAGRAIGDLQVSDAIARGRRIECSEN